MVTGGTSGIGKAAAIALAEKGAKVVVSGRRESEGNAVAALIKEKGGTAAFFRTDITKEADVAASVDFAVKTFGRLDLAFNNAGLEYMGPTTNVTEEDYRKVFDTNVWGVITSLKYEIAAMLKTGGGAIVNTSSVAGHVGMAQVQLYIAAKHAVEGLTKSVALEYAQQNIRVNAIAPAAIRTEMFERFAQSPEQVQYMASLHPVNRVGTVEEIVPAVLYLLDPASAFTTGISLPVDGGFLAQ